ncbi:MAG: hypothetical protein KAY32_05605 [Candidatus Eisenbacteria sp.]|nr:hypothetical protein [Candidatus Eisenbacteria bacterium]
MKQRLGKLERQLFAYAHLRGLATLRTGDLVGPLRISAKQERELLSRLARAEMIAKVRRGLYLVPPRLPLGGIWSPDEILALNTWMEDRAGRYQICGPNAFHRYGFDDQVLARVYAYNNRVSEERQIGSVALTLIRVADARLGGTETFVSPAGNQAVYSSRARTLVDSVHDWSRFDSLPRAFDWIRGDLAAGLVAAPELVDMTLRYGNKGTTRRIGALLELEGVAEVLLARMENKLAQSTSLIPWIPAYAKRGRTSRRWGVVLNERG